MSEVKRISVFIHGPNKAIDMVEAVHLDRVTAERDAALGREAALRLELEEMVRRATAALSNLTFTKNELNDTREAYLHQSARLTAADERADVLEGLVLDAQKAFNYDPAGSCYNPGIAFVKPWSIRAIAALKPAEVRCNIPACDYQIDMDQN